MKKLPIPIIAAVVGVVLGMGTGLYTINRAAQVVVEHAIKLVPHKDALVNEERERGWNFWTIEIEELANELKGERDRLRKQSDQLERREAQLKSERQELNKVRSEIEGLRLEIASKVIEINADEVKNIRVLSQTYTNLTPKAAVAIIRELDDAIVVKILSVMKPEIVAPIFDTLSRSTSSVVALSLASSRFSIVCAVAV